MNEKVEILLKVFLFILLSNIEDMYLIKCMHEIKLLD